MADTKVTDLVELASPASGDRLYIIDDPTGTPTSKQIQLKNLYATVDLGVGTNAPGTAIDVHDASATITINATSDDPALQFQENGTWKYEFYYDEGNNRFALKTTDSDGGGTDADVFRIDDGQTDIDGNTDWLDDQFDYVCEACGWHSGTEADTCPECGGVVAWQDDAALIHRALHGVDRWAFMEKLKNLGLLKLDEAERTAEGYRNVYMPLAGMHKFTLSAIAQLWAMIQEQRAEIAELQAELARV